MIDIHVNGRDPQVLAQLIASTLYGHPGSESDSALGCTGKLVREQQENAERRRPPRDSMATVDFKLIDDDNDWSDV